ncbi:PAS-domain containing protein [Chitinilyticum litopenaei]|uniref:PAS-domain containing protein n=1 Tax=Chitinilyticum litopenaei TaxID=1121276 RepID=UPI000490F883|nr:PAS-domain containing protein [Chitinilyticum litopenaei]
MSLWLIVLWLGLFFAAVFAIAHRAERQQDKPLPLAVYVLALSVYCTSWTFYGSIGRASETGFGFLPVYLGPVLVFLLAYPLLAKLLRASRMQRTGSIADLIATRHGKDARLGAVIAALAFLALIPYLALQLKAISEGMLLLQGLPPGTRSGGGALAAFADPAFWITLLIALLVLLFGAQQSNAGQHRGLMHAIAAQGLFKLLVFLLAGVIILATLRGLASPADSHVLPAQWQEKLKPSHLLQADFWLLTLLSGLAIICLPRQFQVTFVENADPQHLRASRWLFPLYLLLINLFVLPLAIAGTQVFQGTSVEPDTYLLALPLSLGLQGLALLVFLGGAAAALSMLIVESMALASMCSTHLILPLLLKRQLARTGSSGDLASWLKPVRCACVLAVLLLAYLFYREVGAGQTLVGIGLMSFVAIAQFAPALLIGLYWTGGHRHGALAGIVAGFAVWLYTLILPALIQAGWFDPGLLSTGPWGLAWLRPQTLLGVQGLDPAAHATLFSLTINITLYIVTSLCSKASELDTLQANQLVKEIRLHEARQGRQGNHCRNLLEELAHFIPAEQLTRAQAWFVQRRHSPLDLDGPVDALTRHWAETLLAGVLGSAMARVVISNCLDMQEDGQRKAMLSEASQAIHANWEALRTTLDNVEQGVCMFDARYRLVVWNARFFALMNFPLELERAGSELEDFVRHEAVRGGLGAGKPEALISQRMQELTQCSGPLAGVRTQADGRIIAWLWRPLQQGGLVGTFTDITAQRKAAQLLEEKVQERTQALLASEAKLRDFAGSASDWFWETDAEFRFSSVSDRFFQTAGVEPSDVIGKTRWELAGYADPDSLPAHLAEHRRAMLCGETIRDFEYQLQRSDGRLLHLRVSGNPYFDQDGRMLGYRGTGADITDLIRSREELQRTERMASLGGLVAGIAHEINTPLGVGVTAISVVREELATILATMREGRLGRRQLEEFLQLAEDSVHATERNLVRAVDLIRSFKEIAVDQTSDVRREIRLASYLDEIVASLMPALRRGRHGMRCDCPPGIRVHTYPGALAQIIGNLVNNSLLHGFGEQEGGQITLSVSITPKGLQFDYRDDGAGIGPDVARHIFEPFFTTRRGSGGSGLGMHIVYNLVTEQLRGRIDVVPSQHGAHLRWILPQEAVRE